ncbi:hypothetical protein [Thermoplasma sp.]|uniref:hypothetical protein n=1 Tax=Thermoplasma sp. TaxID=1973142 RepID=UPI0012781455|nr:hypothetical protein [Thermoplasma sp.]KAA8921984.1 MAG: PCRF domain-containing protein [Thermoplasma sp.]
MSFKKDVMDKLAEISNKLDDLQKKLDAMSDAPLLKEYYADIEKKMNSMPDDVVQAVSNQIEKMEEEIKTLVESVSSRSENAAVVEKKTTKAKEKNPK